MLPAIVLGLNVVSFLFSATCMNQISSFIGRSRRSRLFVNIRGVMATDCRSYSLVFDTVSTLLFAANVIAIDSMTSW